METQPVPPPKKGAEPPKFSVHIYCGQAAGWIKMALGMEVSLSPGNFVLDGDPASPQKGGGAPSPIFGPFLLWPNAWMYQNATWYGGRPQPRGLCVRWGPTPPQKRGGAPNFQFISIAVKRLHEIKMPMGTEVGLGQDNIVLDGDPAPLSPKRGQSPLPNFWLMSIVAKQLDGSRWHLAWRWALVQATLC